MDVFKRVKDGGACLLVLLALSFLPALAWGQDCPEPGATELDDLASPMLVSLEANELVLNWADVSAERYRISRGRMESLRAGRYDHALIAETVATSRTLEDIKGSFYYLVVGDCPSGLSPTGRLSDGSERPPARTAEVLIALSGSHAMLAGMSFTLRHPGGLFIEPEMVEPVGVLDIPGLFWQANVAVDGEVRATAVSEAPFRSPSDTWLVRFGWPSLAPAQEDFSLFTCLVSDVDGLDAVGVSCSIDGYWVD